jgi:hypothetical protein
MYGGQNEDTRVLFHLFYHRKIKVGKTPSPLTCVNLQHQHLPRLIFLTLSFSTDAFIIFQSLAQ